jgi:hypothetical protein
MVAEHGLASEHFTQERQRILNACRHITEGGVIDQIAHVGAASIPGLTVSCIELAITAWPFPLPASTLMTLAGLGYTPVSSAENSSICATRMASSTSIFGRLAPSPGLILSSPVTISVMIG